MKKTFHEGLFLYLYTMEVGTKVKVIENDSVAVVVAVADSLILVEFEDGSEFGYTPDELEPLSNL